MQVGWLHRFDIKWIVKFLVILYSFISMMYARFCWPMLVVCSSLSNIMCSSLSVNITNVVITFIFLCSNITLE